MGKYFNIHNVKTAQNLIPSLADNCIALRVETNQLTFSCFMTDNLFSVNIVRLKIFFKSDPKTVIVRLCNKTHHFFTYIYMNKSV